jgi:hypothetical protein
MNLVEKASIFLGAILIFKTLETYFEYLKEKRNDESVKLNSSIILLYVAPIPILAVLDLLGISQNQLFFKSLLLGSACYIASEIVSFLSIIVGRLFFRFNPKYSEIRIEDNRGFIVQELLGPKTYKWSDFKHVELRNELKEIELIGKKKKVLEDFMNGYYLLLRKLPSGLAGSDSLKIQTFFDSLSTCEICGLIAVEKDYCLSCSYDVWSEELEEYFSDKDTYIKKGQLDVFSIEKPNQPYHDFTTPTLGLDKDPNWNPKVTREEVLKYSAENYWNKD